MLCNLFESLANAERGTNADIILHLMIVQERQLYVPAGYDSLFSYCVGKLGFSRSTAYRRKAMVDKAGDFPELIERLRDGRLHLCAAAKIAAHLEAETGAELLEAVVGMSHREVEVYLVKRRPAKVSVNVDTKSAVKNELKLDMDETPAAAKPIVTKAKTIVRPLTETTNRVSVTLSDETLANLKRAKELLGNKSDDEILLKALEQLLDKVAPERRHARRAQRHHTPKPSKPSRRGTLADRDKTAVADGCCCSYVSKDGVHCNARAFLEIDHIQPWSLGGPSTAENYRVLCRAHHAYLSTQTFGRRPASPRPSARGVL